VRRFLGNEGINLLEALSTSRNPSRIGPGNGASQALPRGDRWQEENALSSRASLGSPGTTLGEVQLVILSRHPRSIHDSLCRTFPSILWENQGWEGNCWKKMLP